ncbi:MAG: MerR family transcriptional regulator [Magnetococcales bacterium]|nr:MerR family transcriptional regulator [Magnetococcales bacterium]
MQTPKIPLPDKLYFSISEVAEIVDVAAHVLRYWEKKFPQVKPVKRSGNRRFYQSRDVHILLEIRHLLYERRFTVSGAQKYLRENSRKSPPQKDLRSSQPEDSPSPALSPASNHSPKSSDERAFIDSIRIDLMQLRDTLKRSSSL